MLQELTRQIRQKENLSELTAQRALRHILYEEVEDQDIKDFLTALSEKSEAVSEIVGFAREMRNSAVAVRSGLDNVVDTAGTGGGRPTFNISTAAAFVISGAGVPVAKHGNKAITSRAGSADVLQELGVKLCKSPELAATSLQEAGICFMFAPFFHPAMKRVGGIRKEIKNRTIFNMLGPLTNPAGAQYQIIGVFSPAITEKIARALSVLGTRGAWIVHSRDGLDELSALAANRISEVRGGRVQTFELHPEYMEGVLPPGGSPSENASLIMNILEGREKGIALEMTALNAAAAIHLAGEQNMKDALEIARDSIGGGSAKRKLEILREISQSEPGSED